MYSEVITAVNEFGFFYHLNGSLTNMRTKRVKS